ncbi:MAG: amidohydrolase family protein [Bacteriovoracaceae bacterium]|nr:amidohydrolase family protein [Bacteriovoracaceae bacterium]
MKSISAVFATSSQVKRQQLQFNEQTGLIHAFGDLSIPQDKIDFYFNDDCLAFAGMGDIHIHAREDVSQKHLYKEDFQSAGLAAINGGVTHVCDMPNNPIPPIDDESYLAKLKLTEKSLVSFLLYAGIGPQTRPLKLKVPYKAYMGPSIGELFFKNDQELDEVLSHYRSQWVSFHCEDPVELEKHKTEATHHERRPVECEILATKTALRLIEKYNLQGKLCHYSSGEGLKMINQARARGVKVQCEVTPQHLYFSQDQLSDVERGFFQMNPPIRFEYDRHTLLEAAKRGEIEFLATDHAPHSKEEKEKGTSGLTGLDSYGAFVTWLLVDQKFTPERIALMCAENPGAFVNQFLNELSAHYPPFKKLGLGFGFLRSGFMANVTVLNLKSPYKLEAKDLRTKVGHGPFVGVTFPGRVEQVFVQGIAQK